jgi:hypothetical protein
VKMNEEINKSDNKIRKLLIHIIFPCILPYGDFTRESLYIRVWNYLRYSLGIEKCPKV